MPPAIFFLGGSEANLQTSDGCVAPQRHNNEEQVTERLLLSGGGLASAGNQAPPSASFVLSNVLRFLLCQREQSRTVFFFIFLRDPSDN